MSKRNNKVVFYWFEGQGQLVAVNAVGKRLLTVECGQTSSPIETNQFAKVRVYGNDSIIVHHTATTGGLHTGVHTRSKPAKKRGGK